MRTLVAHDGRAPGDGRSLVRFQPSVLIKEEEEEGSMKYCCKRFEDEGKRGFIEALPDSTITVGVCAHCFGVCIKFCPFCGADLAPRFEVRLHGDGWVVFENGERGAYFYNEEEAEKHVLFLTRRED